MIKERIAELMARWDSDEITTEELRELVHLRREAREARAEADQLRADAARERADYQAYIDSITAVRSAIASHEPRNRPRPIDEGAEREAMVERVTNPKRKR